MSTWTTCAGWIAIVPVEEDRTESGRVLLPETAERKVRRGTVIAVYRPWTDERGRRKSPVVRVGQEVLYPADEARRNRLSVGVIDLVREDDVLAASDDDPAGDATDETGGG